MDIDSLTREVLVEVAQACRNDSRAILPTMLHMKGPWIQGHRAVLISPLREGLESFIRTIVEKENGRIWYFPSASWWVEHAKVFHAPNGIGCDKDLHTSHLTKGGSKESFLYGSYMANGKVRVLDAEDFHVEAAYWEKHK